MLGKVHRKKPRGKDTHTNVHALSCKQWEWIMLGSLQDHWDHFGKARIPQAWSLTRALILSLNKGQEPVPAPVIPPSRCANRKGGKG